MEPAIELQEKVYLAFKELTGIATIITFLFSINSVLDISHIVNPYKIGIM